MFRRTDMAQWARTVSYGSASFNAAAVDLSGNVYAAGSQGSGYHIYGPGVTSQGTSYLNALLLSYYGNK